MKFLTIWSNSAQFGAILLSMTTLFGTCQAMTNDEYASLCYHCCAGDMCAMIEMADYLQEMQVMDDSLMFLHIASKMGNKQANIRLVELSKQVCLINALSQDKEVSNRWCEMNERMMESADEWLVEFAKNPSP